MNIFTEKELQIIEECHSNFEKLIRATDQGLIENEDAPEKVSLRKKLISSVDARREFRDRAIRKVTRK